MIKVYVKVKTKAKKEFIKKVGDNNFIVAVVEPPQDGKANKAVVKILAKYYQVSPSKISIVSGLKNKQKILEIFV